MVSPGFLENYEVRRWLNGVEPAWTMLDFESFNALHDEPSASSHAIRLEPNLAKTEISGSAVTANALLLLRRAAETGGLKLTATGNLSRAVVEEMCGIIEWPGYDKDELWYFKVINEPDFLPLHFIRLLIQTAKLVRTHRRKLVPTPLGRRLLAAERHGPLQAVLFHVAFWRLNLGYFDRYPIDSWPQNEIGVVLWSLSRRHTIGYQEKRSLDCAHLLSLAYWNRHGISVPVPWKLGFSDPCFGSGYWNREPKEDRRPRWFTAACTGKRRCLIAL